MKFKIYRADKTTSEGTTQAEWDAAPKNRILWVLEWKDGKVIEHHHCDYYYMVNGQLRTGYTADAKTIMEELLPSMGFGVWVADEAMLAAVDNMTLEAVRKQVANDVT